MTTFFILVLNITIACSLFKDTLLVTLLAACVASVSSLGSGAPQGACMNLAPNHNGVTPQSSDPPYTIVAMPPVNRQMSGTHLQQLTNVGETRFNLCLSTFNQLQL